MYGKNTATITWLKYKNFGTYLQAYGLQQAILGLGYINHIIDDKKLPESRSSMTNRLKSKILEALPFDPRRPHQMLRNATKESNILYNNFCKNYLKVDFESVKSADIVVDNYDQYICGSDQIWSPLIKEHLEGYYYASFTKKKRIAYAASFGVNTYPADKKNEFKSLTSGFSAISCREKIGTFFVRDLLNINAPQVVDPSLLLTGNQWRKIAEKPKDEPRKKYLLTYFLTPNQWYIDYARQYAMEHNLQVVTFYLRTTSPIEADMAICAGPSEFVSMIDNAEVLFTDSFHGSIFATHMETPFVGFRRFSGEKEGQNLRLTDLYSMMNIPERFILDAEDCKRIKDMPLPNFTDMKSRLQPSIDKSLQFLKDSLSL